MAVVMRPRRLSPQNTSSRRPKQSPPRERDDERSAIQRVRQISKLNYERSRGRGFPVFRPCDYGYGRGNLADCGCVCVRRGVVVKRHVRLFALCIRLQQYLSEILVLMLCSLQIDFVESWIVLFDVLQPTVQSPDYMIQLLKKFCPVVLHPYPPKILLD